METITKDEFIKMCEFDDNLLQERVEIKNIRELIKFCENFDGVLDNYPIKLGGIRGDVSCWNLTTNSQKNENYSKNYIRARIDPSSNKELKKWKTLQAQTLGYYPKYQIEVDLT
jgi:hypothetical protein